MSVRDATPALVAERAQSVLQRSPEAEAIVLRARPVWTETTPRVQDRDLTVVPCTTPLAIRDALADRRGEDGAARELLVVLCDLDDADLGVDLLSRFTPPRVLGLEPWHAVEELFDVTRIDSAFGPADSWVADALLTYVPAERARGSVGRTLTLERAYDALARQILGADRFEPAAIVDAALRQEAFGGLANLSREVRAHLLDALGRQQGDLGRLVATLLDVDDGRDLVALGLVARAVYGDPPSDGGAAAGRFESRAGGEVIDPRCGAALAGLAEEAIRRHDPVDPGRTSSVVATAQRVAETIDAGRIGASPILPAGLDARLTVAAGFITTVLDHVDDGQRPAPPGARDALDGLEEALAVVGRHREATAPSGGTRRSHAEMAARLATWLATPAPPLAASFEDTTTEYARDGAWVDWARRRLWEGDRDPVVGATYRRVLDAVIARRRQQNQAFADALVRWTAAPTGADARQDASIVTVEDVLDHVLVPLSRSTPALLVVLDGCGLASFAELAPQLATAGFYEVVRKPSKHRDPSRLTGIAALPTVTEVSRASLLAGRLDRGGQEHERRQFEAHVGLAAGGRRPQLFHQARLDGPAGTALAPAVTTALGPDGPSAVGAVINTIDDHLKRGTFAAALHLQDLRRLGPLLDEARLQGRVVVFSADHGHVLAQPDDGGTGVHQSGGRGGERWREADREPTGSEVVLAGERVVLGPEGGILAPFDDDFRYGSKSGGYHGGATPEEVLVPVAVFAPAGLDEPHGWVRFTPVEPMWWDLRLPAVPSTARTTRPTPSRPTGAAQGAMFDLEPVAGAGRDWVADLLESDVWAVQKGTTTRAQLAPERVRKVLIALVARGGVASTAALAADTKIPETRVRGFLPHLARVLNVEGYVVLDLDAGGTEARLSTSLLAQQFEITVP